MTFSQQKVAQKTEGCCYIPHRYVLFILIFSLAAVVYSTRTTFILALVAMVKRTGSEPNITSECAASTPDNFSSSIKDGEFDWDSTLQSQLLSSFYYGYTFLQIPGGLLAERYGGKWVLFTGILLNGIICIITPLMARLNVYALITVQVFSGLVQGTVFPATFAMWARWAPIQERTVLVANADSGVVVGQLVAYSLTGYMCDSDFLGGWPSVFYLFGSLNLIFCIVWVVFAHNSPAKDPTISDEERKYIEDGTSNLDNAKYSDPPYKVMITSLPMWSIVVAMCTSLIWFYVMFSTIPFYMKQILRFSNTQIGIISTVPVVMLLIGVFTFSFLTDYLRAKHIMSTGVARKAATFVGTVVLAVVFVFIPVVGCDKVSTIVIFNICAFLHGACRAGFVVNMVDIAPIYAGTLSGFINMMGSLSGFIAPIVVEALSGLSSSIDEWSNVFYVTCAVTSGGGLFFVIFGSGEIQEWAKPMLTDAELSKRISNSETIVASRPDCTQDNHLPRESVI